MVRRRGHKTSLAAGGPLLEILQSHGSSAVMVPDTWNVSLVCVFVRHGIGGGENRSTEGMEDETRQKESDELTFSSAVLEPKVNLRCR